MKTPDIKKASNIVNLDSPDFVNIGFSDGASLSAPVAYTSLKGTASVLDSFMAGDKDKFDSAISAMRKARELGDDGLKQGAILNAIAAIDPSLADVPNGYLVETFMGVGKTEKDAEAYLEEICALTAGSDAKALPDFDKLDEGEQRKRVEANSPDFKRKKTVLGYYSIPTTVSEDNPDFDYEKAKAEYRAKLEAKNTFQAFVNMRNAGYPDKVIRDAFRFKTAFDTRNAAAEAYVDNLLSTDDEDYARQFMAAVGAFSPEVRRGFFDRVMTRIAEDSGDRWGNIKDYLLDSNSDGRRFYELARKMKLIDENGNLIADRQKEIEKLKGYFLADKNAALRSNGYGMFEDFDAQKLFDAGKRQIERRKLVRELINANRTRFEKRGAVSETLEEALVNGFTSLEYLGLTLGVSAATGNPVAGIAASSAMMYLDEASNMYEDLRYDGNASEETAAMGAALYGIVASGLEQVQVRGLGRVFVGKKAPYSNFREYVNYGIKESLKNLGREAAVQTATELATSVDSYMTKKFAADFAGATYDERELFDEFRAECGMLIKTMPLITLGFWGAGVPYRSRAYIKDVGANAGSAVRAFFKGSDTLKNNVIAKGVIKQSMDYDAYIKSKYGRNERGREFLDRFLNAKDSNDREAVLNEYYPDAEKREEVKAELEAADKAEREARTEVLKRSIEIAQKRQTDDEALRNGDVVDISVFDGKNENGEYSVLESAIDALGMRENVMFAESARELSEISGISLKAAEEQMSKDGAMGFTSMSDGKIIILKPHLKNGLDALQTFVHEYGHGIMKNIRENDLGGYRRMCDDVLDILGGESMARLSLPEAYSKKGTLQYIEDGRAVAEEILMGVVERVAARKAIDAKSRGIWARVRAWFKSLFDEKTLAEIADEKLAQMALDVLQREKKFKVATDTKPSKNWRAKTPENNGEEVSGQWQVIDADALITSTDEGFDDRLQPRNRSRRASKEQTSDIAVNLDPERLNGSITTDLGAPIVDSRGMVLSGNGRTLAIRQAYGSEKSDRADAYRNFVGNRAREMGLEIPAGAKNPVLVRRVDNFGKMSAEEFAARSNKSQIAGMSVAEQAVADGRRVLAAGLLDYFFPDANGNVLAASNADFINAFLEQVGGSEMYRNSDGSVRSNLSPRIKAAVLAAMLDSDNRETVERLLDNPEGFNALVGGLMQSAANLAELSNKPEYDISEEFSQAVELFVEMRNKGMKLADFSAQGDFFRAAPSDEVMFLMGLFEENAKTPSGISGVLKQYARECKKIDTTTMDMFGTENPSKIEKLEQARDHYAADIAQQDANADLRGKYQEEGPTELAKINRQFRELYDRYKGGKVSAEDLQKEIDDFMGDFHSERTPERKIIEYATPKEKIYDIGEAVDFVRKNLLNKPINNYVEQEGKIVSATISRNCLDKINSGKARGKTNNNRLYALAVANIDRLFTLSRRLESEPPKNGSPELKAVHRHYASLLMDGKVYAVKLTVKEFDEKTGNRIYSIEGIDVNGESDLSGLSKNGENSDSSAAIQRSDSVKEFIDKIRNVNKKFYDLAREKKSNKAYREAAKLVADYAENKGYDVKVYHGTGADGFNVAKADASEAKNGEGAQAHGMGLYLATEKKTAEGYRRLARKPQKLIYFDHEKYEQLPIAFDKLSEKTQKFLAEHYDDWRGKTLDELEQRLRNAQRLSTGEANLMSKKDEISALKEFIPYIKSNKLEPDFFATKNGDGKVFDWFTNLKPENVIDENKTLKEQNEEVQSKLWELWSDNVLEENEDSVYVEDHSKFQRVLTENDYQKLLDAFEGDGDVGMRFLQEAVRRLAEDEDIFASDNVGSEYFLKYGIKGITYEGRLDGRCYVSFEGGSAVKLQDPFTFDDNGELIPLTERFDETNPDMRWRYVEESPNLFERLKNLRGESSPAGNLEENADLDYYFDYFKKNLLGREIQTPIGKFAHFNLGHFNKLIARGENKGESGEVSSLKEWTDKIEHHGVDLGKNPPKGFDYARACNMPLVVDVLQNPQFVLVDTDDTLLFVKKYGEKTYFWCSVMNNGETLGIKSWRPLRLTKRKCEQLKVVYTKENGVVNLAQPRESQRKLDSTNLSENQEKNSRLRFLLRQERTENPVIWASIVLAKEIFLGRKITAAKLETVLPSSKFDGTKREYAVSRAKEIADRYRINKEKFGEKLDVGLQRAESDLYWRKDVMDEMYASFRADGEEYGYIKARLKEWLKNERRRDLENIKGLSSDEIGMDVADAIENAIDAEPERPKPSEKKADETDEEDLDEIESSGSGDAEISDKTLADERFDTRGVIAKIRLATTKIAKQKDFDEFSRRRLYRNTLVEALTDAAKKLSYGIERERILGKISELAGKPYVALKIKDGDRAGQIVDNYTLRAEHIAMRIFNRGVWDSKKALTEKLDAILERRGKKPSRMQRDDKRSMTGLVQQRIYDISRYVKMDAEALEDVRREAIAKLEDVDGNFVQDAEKGKIREDVEDVRAELGNVLHDLEMFGGWDDKSRAEMAQALEFLEKTIDTETAAQRERVEKRKERNAAVRKIISDALKMSEHNAARDGGMRVAIRKVLNGSLPFDSFLGLLGESATGETRRLFEEWRRDLVARIDRAANAKANEVFQTQQRFIKLVEDSYSANFHDALKRLLEKKGEYEKFSKPVDGMLQPMSLANVIQLYVSAAQKNYERNFFEHRVRKSEEDIAEYRKIQNTIDSIQLNNVDEYAKGMLKQSRESLERARDAIVARSVSEYISELEEVLSDGDRRFIEGLRQLYKDELPSISAVAKRVIGLPIEQADALYMPVKVKRSGNLGEGVPQVPVVPKSLSQRVPHLRDLDETADPISLFTDRISENAQFKHLSELYIEMRGIFGDGDLQDLIKQRCGADVLRGLKEFIADIATGKTRGPQNELLRKTNGLTAVMLLGFNLGSGVRQVLPGVASFAPAIGGGKVFKNMMSFFTPEGFAAALEICRSDTGRRRFEIGNMQIMEELLSTPDRNRFWAAYKRHALFFNRFADKLSIMFIGQGIYRSGVGEYLRRGFSEAEAKKLAMSDMWQIAERTQASGRTHNMSHWQRRGGEYGKALGLFSSPPQLMFSMAYAKCRRALALGVKTPEGRAAVWDALSTLFYVSVCVEGSYALSGVLWSALLKGFFDDDDGEQILKQMALGPFGGLFVFGRIIEGAGSNYGTSLAPIEQLSRPLRHTKNLLFDAGQFDADKALEDLDKLAKSLFPLYRDGKKLYENLTD